jgi:thiosulfate dehydrogenase [quinone] large subunit
MTLLETLHRHRTTTDPPTTDAPTVAVTEGSTVAATEGPAETAEHRAGRYAMAVARISIGFVFLWAFLDKLFGLDHATPGASAWIRGGSPTTGFLKGVQGPFADVFHSMSGSAIADCLFMAGLLGIGVALTLGIGLRFAAVAGALLLVFMWAASLPIKTNPFMDDHLVYAVVVIGLALTHAGNTFGLGGRWARLPLVGRFPVLR